MAEAHGTAEAEAASHRRSFLDRGYFSVDLGIDGDTIEECRTVVDLALIAEDGIAVGDSATWPESGRVGLADTYDGTNDFECFGRVLKSPALRRALAVALGDDGKDDAVEAAEFGMGWWVVNFPRANGASGRRKKPWTPVGRKHIDGAHFLHTTELREVSLVLFFLFNDVEKDCGGTALFPGSHKLVSRTLASMSFCPGFAGVKSRTLVEETFRRFPDACSDVDQATGRAGTVYVCHPHLVHSRSLNLSPSLQRGIRYLALPSVPLRAPLRWGDNDMTRNESQDFSLDSCALRVSLRQAYSLAREARSRNRKRKRVT